MASHEFTMSEFSNALLEEAEKCSSTNYQQTLKRILRAEKWKTP
jgi:hypothetical protein